MQSSAFGWITASGTVKQCEQRCCRQVGSSAKRAGVVDGRRCDCVLLQVMTEPIVPPDLRKALAATPLAKAAWSDLTPVARRDFLSWVAAAKQPETRQRRIGRTCDMLMAGKRRPCCYAVVPLDLHNALKAAPAAKAGWSGLTSDARRDFIAWIDGAKAREARKDRIDRACMMLSNGDRQPPTVPPAGIR